MTDRVKVPPLDTRKVCAKCNLPFRCPTAQPNRWTCGPCK